MRAGLAGDLDAARFGLGQRPQLGGRRDVQHMDARARPFGKDGRACDRFDRDDRRTRRQMRDRLGAAGGTQADSRRSMMELVSACSEMRFPVGATSSNSSNIAPVDGEGIRPKVLPM